MPNEPSRVMRQEPVPPGRYWIWIPAGKGQIWLDLQARNKGALQIDKERFEVLATALDPRKTEGWRWAIFFVTAPLSWPKDLGRPNTAPDWIQDKPDTEQRPADPTLHPVDTTAQALSDWLDEVVVPGWSFTWRAALIVAGIYYAAKLSGRD